MATLSVLILTFNSERTIGEVLSSVAFADEIIVLDSFSKDQTKTICARNNVKFIEREFPGWGEQKNFGFSLLKSDWILSLDDDEVLSDKLQTKLKQLLHKDPNSVEETGFKLNFQLVFQGKRLFFGGLSPEFHLRLFKNGKGKFVPHDVHERLIVDGPIGKIWERIYHKSYYDLYEYFEKFNSYTTKAAQHDKKRGKKYCFYHAFRFQFEFIKRYIVLLGFLDGYQGFLYAFLSSFYAFTKYAKLKEIETIHDET